MDQESSPNPEPEFREIVESHRDRVASQMERDALAQPSPGNAEPVHPLLMAMIATVAADGRVLDVEVEKVVRTYGHTFGTEVTDSQRAWVARKAEEVFRGGYDVYDELAAQRSTLNPELIPVIFKACCAVAMCDGRVSDEELILLLRITRALGMSLDEIKEHAAGVVLT